MKKVFLDTNVILDFYLDREEFSDDAEAILALGYNKACSLFVSALTFANFAYIGRKKYPGNTIYEVLESLREFAEITPVDSEVVSMHYPYNLRILRMLYSFVLQRLQV